MTENKVAAHWWVFVPLSKSLNQRFFPHLSLLPPCYLCTMLFCSPSGLAVSLCLSFQAVSVKEFHRQKYDENRNRKNWFWEMQAQDWRLGTHKDLGILQVHVLQQYRCLHLKSSNWCLVSSMSSILCYCRNPNQDPVESWIEDALAWHWKHCSHSSRGASIFSVVVFMVVAFLGYSVWWDVSTYASLFAAVARFVL